MSVYNGSKYLNEQLDSIFFQVGSHDLVVYIRDDGSKDGTQRLIEGRKEYKNGKIILNRGENVGPSKSFFYALRDAPCADYYFFSDQDDIWLPGKIEAAISDMKKQTECPALWFSNYTVVDERLNILRDNGIFKKINSSERILFYNNVPGCVMGFNRRLMVQLRKMRIQEIRMHDIMAFNIATITGKVIFEHNSYLLYRQHGRNVLGYGHKKVRPIEWIKDKVVLLIKKEPYNIDAYAGEILEVFNDYLDEDEKRNYILIRDYKKSFLKKIKLLKKDFTKAKFDRTTLSIRSKIFFELM